MSRERARKSLVPGNAAPPECPVPECRGRVFQSTSATYRAKSIRTCLPSKAAIIAPTLGHGKHFCKNMQIFFKRAQFEKRRRWSSIPDRRSEVVSKFVSEVVSKIVRKSPLALPTHINSGRRSIRSRVAATPIPFPSDRSIRTTEASQTVHPPGPRPRPGGSISTSSSFEPVSIVESV